ncbi:hypothetical protein DXV75_05220 [Alteromonas aestuariivivens]|uniref:Uncharacterized protein n=1 Tax=Alteromonas aestuariivivens TaxID=1938339 RepID=A0A3D8MCN1_9ALTE|nr:M48 family metallopeptidase [Alteromonas aestuariivivens]RDV27433.1 hypothetical protein DXV75_05220 [Alteromonas aestuariivivens]
MYGPYEGQYYLAGSSSCQRVIVRITEKQLLVSGSEGGELVCCSEQPELKVQSRVGNLPREVVLPNRDMLYVEGGPELDSWLDGNSHMSVASKLEKSRAWLIGSLVFSPILLFGIFKYLVPALAITFAAYVPYSLTKVTSAHTLAALDKSILNASQLDAQRQSDLQMAFSATIEQFSDDEKFYKVLFRDSDEMGANAFALPDGTIVFTDGIVELMDGDAQLLNAVLLHEIGHVEHRHSMRMIAESLASTLIISYFFGDVSGAVELFFGVSGTVVQNQYSQKLEWQADEFALQQAPRVGLQPEDFADAMQTLADSHPGNDYLMRLFSSHPSIEERIERARAAQVKE